MDKINYLILIVALIALVFSIFSFVKTPASGTEGLQGPSGEKGEQGDSGISGYEIVEVKGNFVSNGPSLTARCPLNKKVISGGCFISSGNINQMNPDPNDNKSWHCAFTSASEITLNQITAYAICANVE